MASKTHPTSQRDNRSDNQGQINGSNPLTKNLAAADPLCLENPAHANIPSATKPNVAQMER